MIARRRSGRPRASSWAVLEEAAGELFLEQGYASTSIADITRRAGVSRNTFFNYFTAKSDLLWSGFDTTFADLPDVLLRHADEPVDARVRSALLELAGRLPAENVALAYGQAEPMGLAEELRQAAALRISRVAAMLSKHAQGAGLPMLQAEVGATAYAGALTAAIAEWSRAGAGRNSLPEILTTAWAPLAGALERSGRA